MSWVKGSGVPVAIVFVCGLLTTVAYFIDVKLVTAASEWLQTWAIIIAGFSLGLGVVNMVAAHGSSVMKLKGKWPYSAVFLLFFAAQAATGLIDISTLKNPVYIWLYTNVYSPLSATSYALLGFFIVSAAYRAMRARNLEASLLLIAGALVMLNNAPIGGVIWSGFPVLGAWVLDVIGAGGNRAVLIGAGIGTILLGLRILLGYERGYLGGD